MRLINAPAGLLPNAGGHVKIIKDRSSAFGYRVAEQGAEALCSKFQARKS